MKTIICRCEDITLNDINKAISKGYTDLESIKRFTGLGTGTCQAKSCILNLVKILKQNNLFNDDMKITSRPPADMVEFKKII